jgi:hypothetical protein
LLPALRVPRNPAAVSHTLFYAVEVLSAGDESEGGLPSTDLLIMPRGPGIMPKDVEHVTILTNKIPINFPWSAPPWNG